MIDKAQLLADFKAARKQGLQPMVVRIGKGDGMTVNAFADTGEEYTVWARAEENGDPLVVYFTPGKVTYAELGTNLQFEVERNDRDQLELKRLYTGVRDSLGGAPLPTNAYDWIHTHESDVEAGQLNASNVFDDGTVPVEYGGTNIASYAVGDIIYASGATTLSKLADVAVGNALISGGVNTAPAWGKIGLTTHVSGTLPVGNGGTGAATLTANNVILGNGTSAVQFVAPGTSGNVLTSNGTTWTSAAPSGGSPFTHSGGLIYPTTTTDNMTLGGSTNIAKLGIIGDTDEPQLIVRGNGTQTSAILDIQNSTPNSLFKITSTAAIFNDDSLDRDFIVEGNGDALLFNTEGTNDRVGIGKVPALAKLDILGTVDEPVLTLRPMSLQSTSVFTILNGAGATMMAVDPLGTLSFDGGAIFNESGNTGASFRVESDSRTHMLYVLANDNAVGINNSTPTAMLDIGASLTGQASLGIQPGTAPTSPNNGDRWHDSTRKAMMSNVAGNTGSDVQGLFTQTALTGNNNTTAAVSMFGTGVTSRTIAANFFTIGKTLEIDTWGIYQTNGARDITWELKAGSTVLVSQGPISHNSGGTGARFWRGRFAITCYTTGASGTFWTQGEIILHDGTLVRFFNTTTNVLNTTTSHLLDLTWQYATTSSTTNAYAGIGSIKEIN